MQVSSVEQIQKAEATRLVALKFARQPDGSPVVVKIRAVRPQKLIAIMEGIAQTGDSPGGTDITWAEVQRLLEEAEGPHREIARLALVEPAFAFDGPEEGKVNWQDLHPREQAHLAQSILAFSGLKDGDPEDAAFGTFPAREPGGG